MALSSLRLIKQCALLQPQEALGSVPSHTRGIYVLFKHQPRTDKYDVVYVGLAGGPETGIRGRLRSHYENEGISPCQEARHRLRG